MSWIDEGKNLADALRLAYPGPEKPKRIAFDWDVSLATAKNMLSGAIPHGLAKFIHFARRRPEILQHLIKNDWTSRIALTREMSNVRSSIEAMERRLAESTRRNRVGSD